MNIERERPAKELDMTRKIMSKERVLELVAEIAGELGNDVADVRRNLNYYYAGYGEMDDDFSRRAKAIGGYMTKSQWKKVLATITDDELASVIPAEEVETVQTAEEEETAESVEVKMACDLLQGYLDDQGDGTDVVPECSTWDEFRMVCAEFFCSPDYFIENYIKVNMN